MNARDGLDIFLFAAIQRMTSKRVFRVEVSANDQFLFIGSYCGLLFSVRAVTALRLRPEIDNNEGYNTPCNECTHSDYLARLIAQIFGVNLCLTDPLVDKDRSRSLAPSLLG